MCLYKNVCVGIGGTLTLSNKRIKRGWIKSYLILQEPLGTGVSPCARLYPASPPITYVRRKTPTRVGEMGYLYDTWIYKFFNFISYYSTSRAGQGGWGVDEKLVCFLLFLPCIVLYLQIGPEADAVAAAAVVIE